MTYKIGNYEIPFDKDGNQLDYAWSYGGVLYKQNEIFEDTLLYKTYGRGRSSATFTFERMSGLTVSVFMSDMDVMIPHMMGGQIMGKFTFVKKGANYGCKLLEVA